MSQARTHNLNLALRLACLPPTMSSSPGHYQATDPIINSSFTPFSSVSRVRQGDGSVARRSETHASETAPLLGHGAAKPAKKPFYRPRPLWCVLQHERPNGHVLTTEYIGSCRSRLSRRSS